MREDKLQHEIIMWFGQTYPYHSNYFFEVNNNPKNAAHGSYRKSLGMKKNGSDTILMQPTFGIMAGIEFKAPGSVWPKTKIENQLNWGLGLIKNNGYYMISSNITEIKIFIVAIMSNNIYIANKAQNQALVHVQSQLHNKTIKF